MESGPWLDLNSYFNRSSSATYWEEGDAAVKYPRSDCWVRTQRARGAGPTRQSDPPNGRRAKRVVWLSRRVYGGGGKNDEKIRAVTTLH
ncbi:hypothetical protein GN956_G21932 [Arapaima gigas]